MANKKIGGPRRSSKITNKAPISFIVVVIFDWRLQKNEAHRSFISNFWVPSRSSFFVCHRLDVIKKKRVYVYPFVRIHFVMLTFTSTYLRYSIPHTCYFSKCLYFYILRFDTYFKIKNLSQIRYKIILPLMVRAYQVCFKLFLVNPGAQVLIQTRTYVC